MMKNQTSNCKATINGNPVSEMEFIQFELERARVALALLKEKLGISRLQDLLKEETDISEKRMAEWLEKSNGNYTPSPCEIEVVGVSAEAFLEWYGGRVAANDQATLDAANPEHYVVTPTKDGALDVIETTGAYGYPTRFIVRVDQNDSASPNPDDIDEDYPIRMNGYGYLMDTREYGRILHQFVNTKDGFKAKLAIYFPSAVPAELIEGHKWHLVCEFTNWVNMFLESIGQR